MAKSQVNARVPDDLEDVINQYSEERGVDRAEAARQLMRRGSEGWRGKSEASKLAEQATSVGAVASVTAAIMIPIGPAWAISAAVGSLAATLIFGLTWAAIRTVERGR